MIFESIQVTANKSWLCAITTNFPQHRIELTEFHPFNESSWRGILHITGDATPIKEWLSLQYDVSDMSILSEEAVLGTSHQSERIGSSHADVQESYICFQSSCHEKLRALLIKNNVFLRLPVILHEGIIEIQLVSTEKNLNAFFKALSVAEEHHIKLKRKVNILTLNNPKLTQKQREIMQLAIDEGYYEIPRRISLHEMSEHFQISQSTIGEHLRKIERYVMNAV